jgi:hypothetical protein
MGFFQPNAGYHAGVVEGDLTVGDENFWLAGVQ